MNRGELLLGTAVGWLALVGLGGWLWVRRRRAPRAVGLALPAVALLAAGAGWVPAFLLVERASGGTVGLPKPLELGLHWASSAGFCLAVLLLPVAAMAGRRPGGRHDR